MIESLRVYDIEVAAADLFGTLGRAVSEANDRLRRKVAEDPELDGMGTTLTAMLWSGRRAAVAHIGDSRGYLLREGKLRRITEDHTLGGLVADVTVAGLASVLVRYLDGRPDRSPDLAAREVRSGDRYLLCSDGLSGVLAAGVMRDVLTSTRDAGKAVSELIDLANGAGGPDNITVAVVDVGAEGGRVSAGPVMVGAAADAAGR